MTRVKQTFGTQVRRLLELLDGDVVKFYEQAGLDYRPRYTPVMRLLLREGAMTVGELANRSGLTQPAVSQTLREMKKADLVVDAKSEDRRQRRIALSAHGESLREMLEGQWAATREAAASLDEGLAYPLSELLAEAIESLEADPFADRIRRALKTEEDK